MPNARPVSMILFTTSDGKSSRPEVLVRMLDSVSAFLKGNPDIKLKHFLLMQRTTDEERERLSSQLPDFVELYSVPNMIPLSNARNLLLSKEIGQQYLAQTDIVAFPDDDCWYPSGILERIASRFSSNPKLDFWFCRYGSNPAVDIEAAAEQQPSVQTVIARASSNTIFFRGKLVGEIGGFSEELGVGTKINGGEDTDYALRAYASARDVLFLDAKAVGHRDFDPALRARYFPGSLVAIWRNTRGRPAVIWAAVRKLVVGLSLVLLGKMSPKQMIEAVKLLV